MATKSELLDFYNQEKIEKAAAKSALESTLTAIDEAIVQLEANIIALNQQKEDTEDMIAVYVSADANYDQTMDFIETNMT